MKKKYKVVSRTRFIIFITLMILIMFSSIRIVFGFDNSDSINKNRYKSTTVQEGDTLWSIAQSNYDENVDIREKIRDIIKINHLETVDLHSGDEIMLPI